MGSSSVCCRLKPALLLSHGAWHRQRPSPVQPCSLASRALELNSESLVMISDPKQPLAGRYKMRSGLQTAGFLGRLFLTFPKSFLLTRGP